MSNSGPILLLSKNRKTQPNEVKNRSGILGQRSGPSQLWKMIIPTERTE